MYPVIRRIISESDNMEQGYDEDRPAMMDIQKGCRVGAHGGVLYQQDTATGNHSPAEKSTTPNVVEPDSNAHGMNIDMPDEPEAGPGGFGHFDSASSLSDDGTRDMMQDVAHDGNYGASAPPTEIGTEQSTPGYQPGTQPSLKRAATSMQHMDNDSSSGGSMRASSQNSSRDWGWFEDVHHASDHVFGGDKRSSNKARKKKGGLVPQVSIGEVGELRVRDKGQEASAMAVTAPTYVLEESLSSQRLWKDTAGQRPPQPVEERAFFEKMWAQNFSRSQVNYRMPVEVLTAASPIALSPFADGVFDGHLRSELPSYSLPSAKQDAQQPGVAEEALVSRLNDMGVVGQNTDIVNKTVKGYGSDGDLVVLVRGDNVFGTTVSKSFPHYSERGGQVAGVDTVNISIASYRVVNSIKRGRYAQFLVIYREGSIRDTLGVWKRYSDFEELARKVTQAHEGCASVIAGMSPLAVTAESETEHLPNAITSWRLLKKRQRWFRCLDSSYLSLKVFLLERFLHDVLFESSSPKLLLDFVLGAVHPEMTCLDEVVDD